MTATIRGRFVGMWSNQYTGRVVLQIEVDDVYTTIDWIKNELPKSQRRKFTNAPAVALLDVSTVSAGTSPTKHINTLARFAIDNPEQMHDIMRQIKELTDGDV